MIIVYIGVASDERAVLQAARAEAQLRGLPVHAVTTWQSRFTDAHDHQIVLEGNREARAKLDRLLEPWARRYSDIDISSVAVHDNLLGHLTRSNESVRLVVIGTRDCAAAVGPGATAVLHGAECSVLVVGTTHL
ncbi:MAG: universal stress protein [Mycobacterium sp.]